jgi:hypothetical protein
MKRYLTILITFATLSSFGQGIGAWQLETAPTGQHYLIFSDKVTGVFDTIPADRLISDSLGYSRIDSIKCVSDTIRIYTNNGQFKMPFSCSGGGGGGGGITSLNGLTGSTQTFAVGTSGTNVNISSATSTHTFNFPTASATNRGVLSTTDWTTFNSKLSGDGALNRIPYYNGTRTFSNSNSLMWDMSSSKLGIGYAATSDTSLIQNDLTASKGITIKGTSSGMSFRSSSTWWQFIVDDTRFGLWSDALGGSDKFKILYSTAQPYFRYFDSSGGGTTGSNKRILQTDNNGLITALTTDGTSDKVLTTNGSGGYSWVAFTGGATNLSWSGIASTSATLNSSTGTDVTFNAGTGVTFSGTTSLTINAASSGTVGLTSYQSIMDVGAATSVYQYTTTSGATPTKVLYNSQSTGNITYYNGTSFPSGVGNLLVPTTGTYEILYSHDVSSNSTTGTKLYSGIYISDTYSGGTSSFNIQPFVTNQSYHHSGRIVRTLNSGQVVQVKMILEGATGSHNFTTAGAQLTLKKLN